MPEFALLNPRKKTRRKTRRKATTRKRSTARRNPARRRRKAAAPRRRRYARRNPRKLTLRSLQSDYFMPALAMGAGAVLVDGAYGALPLPANMKTGVVGGLAKSAVAIGAGMLVGRFAGKKLGTSIALGGLAVQIYNFAKPQIQSMFPQISMGEFVSWGPSLDFAQPAGNDDLAYVNPGRVLSPPNGAQSGGDQMGMYLSGGYGGYSGY